MGSWQWDAAIDESAACGGEKICHPIPNPISILQMKHRISKNPKKYRLMPCDI
jgi:hypothetical protein